MKVVSIISTKGRRGQDHDGGQPGRLRGRRRAARALAGPGRAAHAVNRHFTLAERAPAGIYEMLAHNEQRAPSNWCRRTAIAGSDLILSNDDRGELNTLLHVRRTADCGCATCCDARAALRPAADRHQGRAALLLEIGGAGLGPGTVAGDAGNPSRHASCADNLTAHRGTSRPTTGTSASSRRRCLLSSTIASGVFERPADPAGAAADVPGTAGCAWLDADVPAIEAYPRSNARPAGTSGGIPPAGVDSVHPRRWVPCARWPGELFRRVRRFALVAPARSEAGRDQPWPARMNWRAAWLLR